MVIKIATCDVGQGQAPQYAMLNSLNHLPYMPSGAWTPMGVQLVNQAFQAAAAKGITICCASGDDGSSDQVTSGAHVDFPASSPFALGVGGTKLVATNETPPTIQSETVWNETMQ